jgi:cysteine synthase B
MRVISSKAALDEAIGNTPLVPLRRISPRGSAQVWAKVEGANPGGSVKDRPARAILQAAEAAGLMSHGRALLDASSGNTGIAFAMLCAARGYDCVVCLPDNANTERKRLLAMYGATVVLTPPEDGSDGAIVEARRRAASDPDRYFYADQYNNPNNVLAHYETTGPEIWRQTAGRITHFVVGVGTSGTLMGTGRRLRELDPWIRVISVQPDAPFHGIEGWKHMPTAIVPGIYDPDFADETLTVRTEDGQAMARRLAREEGLLTGSSGGANVEAALGVAKRLSPGDLVVTVLPDGGERYLHERWWEE